MTKWFVQCRHGGLMALLLTGVLLSGCADGAGNSEQPLVRVPAEALGLTPARPTVYYIPTYLPDDFDVVADKSREGWFYVVASSQAAAWGLIEFGYYANQSQFLRGTPVGVLGRAQRNYEVSDFGILVWWSDGGVNVRLEVSGLDLETAVRFVDGLTTGGEPEWQHFVKRRAR